MTSGTPAILPVRHAFAINTLDALAEDLHGKLESPQVQSLSTSLPTSVRLNDSLGGDENTIAAERMCLAGRAATKSAKL
jgi:hypothetical protein